jgi:hypothetical protein
MNNLKTIKTTNLVMQTDLVEVVVFVILHFVAPEVEFIVMRIVVVDGLDY